MKRNFLFKFASRVIRGAKVIVGFKGTDSPIAMRVTENDTLMAIAQAIVDTEVRGQVLGVSGHDKLRMTIPVVEQIIMSGPLLGKEIENEELFREGVSTLVSGGVQIFNAIHEDHVTEEDNI